MLARLCAFVVWALVGATAVFWGLRLLVHAPATPAAAVAVGDAAAVRVDLTRLLGAAPVAVAAPAAAAEASSRFRLLGIMAAKPSTAGRAHGVALIAVDGKLPKAYRVGSPLDGELVLQSVSLRSAAIGPARGGPTVTLELPALPTAATGTLPVALFAPVPTGMAPGLMPRSTAQTLSPQMMPAQITPTAPLASPPGFVPPQPRDLGASTQ